MKIAITGGTGFVGSHLANELMERGNEVTAISRNPDETKHPVDDEVELEKGDVTELESLKFEGYDVVVHLVALSPLFKPPVPYEDVHVEGTRNVLEACDRDGVDELVHLSALGVEEEGDTEYDRTKARAESLVKDSSLNWTVFKPSVIFGDGGEFVGFTKTLTTPVVTGLPGGGKTKFQPIWVEDVVDMVADAVENREEYGGGTYEIAGPEILTLKRITQMAYEADGKKTRILPVPMAVAKIGLSIADGIDAVPMGKDQYKSLKNDNVVERNDAAEFGYDEGSLTSIGGYLGVA
ncbi:MAG: complex I NDUFA9 subunit family protein [Halobacteria archaeon]